MSKELNQLKGQAIIIRDEDKQGLNTSERVGSLFLDIVEWLDEHKKDASSSGGGGGSSDFIAYNPILSINAINGNPNTSNQVLVWTGNSWGYRDYQTGGSGGGTSLTDVWASLSSQDYTKQINYSHLTDLEWWGCKFNNGSVINGKIIAPNGIQIGGATITWDGSALKVDKTLYSTSGVSALGNDSSSGGGGGEGTVDLNEPLSSINALDSNPSSSDTKILVWRTGSWGYENLPSGGSSSTDVYWDTILGTPPGVSTFSNDVPYLTSSSISDMATKTWVGKQGYLTSSSITDMATKTWVGRQGFALASNVYSKTDADAKFMTIVAFENLFNALNSNDQKVSHPYSSGVASIKAMVGLWTEQYLSALGKSNSGGETVMNEPLASINDSGLAAHPSSSGQTIVWNGSAWVYSTVGGGTGTVTSITAGTGLSGGTITNSGTIGINSTYQSYITHGETAYGWGNHARAGYLKSITSSMVTTALGYTPANSTALRNYLPLSGGTVTGDLNINGNVGIGTTSPEYKLDVAGTFRANEDVTFGRYVDFLQAETKFSYSGGSYSDPCPNKDANFKFGGTLAATSLSSTETIQIGNAQLVWDSANNALKAVKTDGTALNFYATGGVSALGMSEGTSTVDSMTFNYLKVKNSLSLPQTIVAGAGAMLVGQVHDSPCIYLFNGYDTSKISFHSYYYNQYKNVGLKGTDYNSSDSWFIDPDGAARFSRIYLDSVRYLYIVNNTLCYYDGSTRKTIQLV